MKNYTRFLALAMAFSACTSPEDILDDFQIHLSPSFFKYVVEMEVKDLNDQDAEFNSPVSISVIGQDAASVYNIDGTKNFKLNYGTLQLMIRSGVEPTDGNPLKFTVHIAGQGYLEQSIPVTIQEEDYYLYRQVDLLNFNNLPNTVAVKEKTQAIDPSTGRLTAPMVLSSGSPDSLSRIQLIVPTNVNFLDKNGNVISPSPGQSLKARVIALSDTSSSAQAAMPNGGGLIQPLWVDGVIQPVAFDPSATFKIDLTIGNQSVVQFSSGGSPAGISARIPVPSTMFNMEKNRVFQVGDSISLSSLSDGDQAWSTETDIYEVKLDQATGDLYAEPIISHLSWYRYSYCYHYWFFARPVPKYYYFTGHLDQANGEGINAMAAIRTQEGWYGFYNTVQGTFSNKGVNNNPNRSMVSYSTSNRGVVPGSFLVSGPSGLELVQVETYTWGGATVFDARLRITRQPPTVGYRFYCPTSNAVVSPPAGTKFYCRKTGTTDPFKHLHTVTSLNQHISQQKMYELEDGIRYDFRAQFNTSQVDTANVLVEDGTIYNIPLSEATCADLGL